MHGGLTPSDQPRETIQSDTDRLVLLRLGCGSLFTAIRCGQADDVVGFLSSSKLCCLSKSGHLLGGPEQHRTCRNDDGNAPLVGMSNLSFFPFFFFFFCRPSQYGFRRPSPDSCWGKSVPSIHLPDSMGLCRVVSGGAARHASAVESVASDVHRLVCPFRTSFFFFAFSFPLKSTRLGCTVQFTGIRRGPGEWIFRLQNSRRDLTHTDRQMVKDDDDDDGGGGCGGGPPP